jgi:hypothetical protein
VASQNAESRVGGLLRASGGLWIVTSASLVPIPLITASVIAALQLALHCAPFLSAANDRDRNAVFVPLDDLISAADHLEIEIQYPT